MTGVSGSSSFAMVVYQFISGSITKYSITLIYYQAKKTLVILLKEQATGKLIASVGRERVGEKESRKEKLSCLSLTHKKCAT